MRLLDSKSLVALLLVVGECAAVSTPQTRQIEGSCIGNVTLDASTNIWKTQRLHANTFYRRKVETAAARIGDLELKRMAFKVGDVGSFVWLSAEGDHRMIDVAASDVVCGELLGLVINGVPNFGCDIPGTHDIYTGKLGYYYPWIDAIAEAIKNNPKTAFALIIEPGLLSGVVLNDPAINQKMVIGGYGFENQNPPSECRVLVEYYRSRVPYALKQLNLPNVVMYLDADHEGLLGWRENIPVAAAEMVRIIKAAGSPSQLRGFSTNVANFNSMHAFNSAPGEFATADRYPDNPSSNSVTYARRLSAALTTAGAPWLLVAIIDTSRNAVQGLRFDQTHMCNVNGAGFGVRPLAWERDREVDALVWVKHGGESDGTSDPASPWFDEECGGEDAYKPSPARGEWSQEYFEMLLENAKPGF